VITRLNNQRHGNHKF